MGVSFSIKLIGALLAYKIWDCRWRGQKQSIKTTVSCEAMASGLPLLLLVLCSLTAAEAWLRLYNLRASGLDADTFSAADGYVKVFCGSAKLGETSVNHNNANPWWTEEFSHFKAQENGVLRLEVHDEDIFYDDLLGICQCQIKVGTHEHNCFLKEGGTLHYMYTFSM
ncbi:perforin-1-like isoform X1 [Scophthalmus maximus]|uniref:perforin-1-like isoform X1 n=2 Tax=Scophthalmus maximus TaxID=52904 RepID=UPI001FA9094E|nr:perforin-1-like isoform X1 [Scophthalmus maximus]